MKQFKLYAIYKQYELLLTHFNNQDASHSNSITFDEHLTENDFDQYTLTFSSMRVLPSTNLHIKTAQEELLPNYYSSILQLGTQLRLETDDKIINFIISDIAPKLSRGNVQYNYTAQDELSYLWSRHNLGYSYPMTEEEENSGIHNIYEYAEYILRDNYLDSVWWAPATDQEIAKEYFTFSIDNSNPYNALIEACNVLGYSFHADYNKHQIIFYKKEKNKFSGYRFRPEVNIKSFSASYSATDFCTMLHATGGTDEHGSLIPLVPYIPHCFQVYFSSRHAWMEKDFINKPILYRHILLGLLIHDNIGTKQELSIDNALPVELSEVFRGTNIEDNSTDSDARDLLNEIQYSQESYFIYNPDDSEENEFSLEEINEALTFTRIAEQVPTLGQFLYDFSFWELNGCASKYIVKDIKDIFNRMQKQNVMLKIYTPQYYRLISTIAKINAKLEGYAEQYEAEYRAIEDKIKNSDKTIDNTVLLHNFETLNNIQNNILNELTPSYFELYRSLYGTVEKVDSNKYTGAAEGMYSTGEYNTLKDTYLFDEWMAWAKAVDSATASYKKYEKRYLAATAKLGSLTPPDNDEFDDEWIATQGEQASALEFMNTYKTLMNHWEILDSKSEAPTILYTAPGKYSLLLGLIWEKWQDYIQHKNLNHEHSLEYKIKKCEDANNALSQELYVRYGTYIYEKDYTNTDEFDSVGLYNQAISAFQTYNRPQAKYNLTIIDLNCLEEISLPSLTIGSHIYVYNDYLNLAEGEQNNIQYTNNDLIVTGINRKLRSSDDVQLIVEKLNQGQDIIAKLLSTIS